MSTIVAPAANAVLPSSYTTAVANQLNQQKAFIRFTPGATVSTPAAGTADWFTIGTLTVPSWATQALVTLAIDNTFSGGVAGQAQVVMKVGTAIGNTNVVLGIAAVGGIPWVSSDLLTSVPTGSQTFKVTATFVSGAQISVGVNSHITANIDYLG